VREWRQANAELLARLSAALQHRTLSLLVRDVFAARDHLQREFRNAERETHERQRELIAAAQAGDYLSAAGLAQALVPLKARTQAYQAAHHEIDALIHVSRVTPPPPTSCQEPLSSARWGPTQTALFASPEASTGKVIPLRK
jgi:hypothetical protein